MFNTQYGNAQFVISDTEEAPNQFTFYRGLYLGNKKYNNEKDTNIEEGDVVLICGKIVNYRGSTPETVQNKAYVVSINGVGPAVTPTTGGDPKGSGTQADPFNVAAAVAKCKEIGETASTDKYYVKGIADGDYTVGSYKNIDVDLVDSEGSSEKFKVYHCKGVDGKDIKEGFKVSKGDVIIVYGPIINYKGNTPETATGAYVVSINGNSPVDGGGGGDTPASDAKKVTIAEFNAASESDEVWYQLTGTVKNLKDDDIYGNFDLEDETGSVYVYGLLSEKGGEKKKFQELVAAKGIKEGSKITIIGTRGSYKDKIEVMNAYFVSIEGGSDGGDNTGSDIKSVSVADFNAAAESNDVWYQLKGKVKNLKDEDIYGNFDLEDETGSVYVYGLLSEKGGEKKKFQDLVAAQGIKEGSIITIIGNRGSYKDKIEVMNAYFVSIEK